MTYNVLMGTLNPVHSLTITRQSGHLCCSCWNCLTRKILVNGKV